MDFFANVRHVHLPYHFPVGTGLRIDVDDRIASGLLPPFALSAATYASFSAGACDASFGEG